MKKKVVLALMATAVLCMTGCTVTKTTEIVETPVAQEEVIEEEVADISEESEIDISEAEENGDIEIAEFEDDNAYRISYSEDFYEETENADIDDSMLVKCAIDKEHENENYIDVMYQDEYSYEEYLEGITLQSGTDDVYVDKVSFGRQGIEADLVTYNIGDDFNMCFYIIPHNEGCYVVEIGSHIYGEDDEELAYRISGAMEEVVDSIEFSL